MVSSSPASTSSASASAAVSFQSNAVRNENQSNAARRQGKRRSWHPLQHLICADADAKMDVDGDVDGDVARGTGDCVEWWERPRRGGTDACDEDEECTLRRCGPPATAFEKV